MGAIVVRYLSKNGSGKWQYRRAIPGDLKEFFGKREFKAVLGSTESEAIAAYGRHHAEIEALIARTRTKANSPYSQHQRALDKLEALGVSPEQIASLPTDGSDQSKDWLDSVLDQFIDETFKGKPVGPDGYPVTISPTEQAVIDVLAKGRLEKPVPNLRDALDFYEEEKLQGLSEFKKKRRKSEISRIYSRVIAIIEHDRPIDKLNREQARKIRDAMLADGLKPASVRRYLNTVKAALTLAIREQELDCRNPFVSLPISGSAASAEDRKPFTREQLAQAGQWIAEHANTTQQRVWRILRGTGARRGEILGLSCSDVQLDAEIPHILIQRNDVRDLKTASSHRTVPLLGDAYAAAKEALEAVSKECPHLFPRYADESRFTSCSNQLNEHIRKAGIADQRITLHSLRHTMKDALRDSDVPSDLQKALLGHSGDSVADNYGAGESLRRKREALSKALEWMEADARPLADPCESADAEQSSDAA